LPANLWDRTLEKAWKNFHAGARSDLRQDFGHFVEEHAHWLDDYALFRQAEGTSADADPALLRLAWSSVAALAIAPLQDVLNLRKEARMNQPGSAQGNWRWRATDEMLSASALASL
jgi:4-alpha-glucanotransferase